VPKTLKLPVFGEISLTHVSLPVLTLMLAAVDGFNPCAMWTLVFLISLLVGLRDRFRMWVLGSLFILASAGVYFLFMAAWLNLLLFLGMLPWIRLSVGLLALGGGGYYLYLSGYIFIFMLDDLFVFFVAMKTLQVTGLTGTYVRHAHALGGAVLVVIGLMLLFKPEWLTFRV
jgi:hypothetical protein